MSIKIILTKFQPFRVVQVIQMIAELFKIYLMAKILVILTQTYGFQLIKQTYRSLIQEIQTR